MVFILGFIIGAVSTYGVVKWSVRAGHQGEFKFCTGCPLKGGFPLKEDDFDDIEDIEETKEELHDGYPNTSPRKLDEFFND